MERCQNTKDVTMIGHNKTEKKGLLFNPSCKSWSCDFCCEQLKDNWIHQAARGSMIMEGHGNQLQFVTLTSRGSSTPNKSVYFFKENWPKLRKRMADRTNEWTPFTGIEWAYFLVPERHESGVLHVHLIASTHICAESVWKQHAHQTGFGYIIDVQEMITPLLAATYVAKYLHKGMGAETWPRGFRRVRHSQNWPIAKPKKDEKWEWMTIKNEDTVWFEKNAMIDLGWQVTDRREK